MKYLETKHERNSAKITTLLVLIITLLCFVVGQDYKEQPEEYGVALDFGNSAAAGGNVQPVKSEVPEEAIEEEVIEEEIVEEEIEEETIEEQDVKEEVIDEETEAEEEKLEQEMAEAAEAEAAEKLLAQEAEEALKIKEAQEAKEAKEKLEREAKEAKEKADKVAAEKKAAEAKAKADKEAKAKAVAEAKAQKAEADRLAKAKAAADLKAAADAKAKSDAAAAAKKKNAGTGEVRFSLIENAPVYPGCEGGDNEAKKKCMSEKVKQFIAKNYNTDIASDISGVQRISIFFKINTEGNVVGVKAKASDPKLETEAKRVTALLPKVKPGMQQGKPVVVRFGLAINISLKN